MKKRSLVVVLAAFAVAATGAAAAHQAGFLLLPRAASAGQMTLFGHVRTLKRVGGGYRLRFDPAWFTSGITANTAAAEDGAVPKGQPVPNDNYVVDESHRTLLFEVPASARATVLVDHGTSGLGATRVSISELAQIVAGKPTRHKLFEPLDSGVWIRVRIDTVQTLDQQYRP